MPQGTVCLGQAEALEIHVQSEFTSLHMAPCFSPQVERSHQPFSWTSLLLWYKQEALSSTTESCLRFVSSYSCLTWSSLDAIPKLVKWAKWLHLSQHIPWGHFLGLSQLTTHNPRDIFFFSHELTYLPHLYQGLPLWERRHQRIWNIVTLLDERREMLSPLLAPPTPHWCVNSSLTNAWVSLQVISACSCPRTKLARKRKYQWPMYKQFFVIAHGLKQLVEHHSWNCGQGNLPEKACSLTGTRTQVSSSCWPVCDFTNKQNSCFSWWIPLVLQLQQSRDSHPGPEEWMRHLS